MALPLRRLSASSEFAIVEKWLYPLWKRTDQTVDELRDTLLGELSPKLMSRVDVHGLRLCVADSAVAAASARRMESCAPVPDAMLSLWVDSGGVASFREALVDQYVARKTAYLVEETEPLVSQLRHPSQSGERVYGMCQVVFLSSPAAMAREDFLTIWKGSHTQVAIDTQSTFGYRQNLVVSEQEDNARHCDAIVEENFPPEAMTDDHAFYATGGDDAVLKKHMQAMMESCSRFIDFAKIDVIPMSEYRMESPPDRS